MGFDVCTYSLCNVYSYCSHLSSFGMTLVRDVSLKLDCCHTGKHFDASLTLAPFFFAGHKNDFLAILRLSCISRKIGEATKDKIGAILWLANFVCQLWPRTTDTQWRHKSKISEKLGRFGRQNMLRPYLKIWEWEWIFGRAVKAISSLGVRSPWYGLFMDIDRT